MAIVAAFLLPLPHAKASTQVAFLEVIDGRGDRVQLEPDFPYAHMAIEIDGGWLHAHPASGAEWVPAGGLERYGRIARVLDVPSKMKVRTDLVDAFIGQPYDREFSWDNRALYCSELVAKILDIEPVPMVFDPRFWPADFARLNGKPGISPGLVFRKISSEAYSHSAQRP
jgi:hypothetical protein